MTRKKEQADVWVPYRDGECATHALAKFSLDTPPVVQSHIPGTEIHSPENFGKNEKAASNCGGTENYLTNEGIDAIVSMVPHNPGRHSTMNPDEGRRVTSPEN